MTKGKLSSDGGRSPVPVPYVVHRQGMLRAWFTIFWGEVATVGLLATMARVRDLAFPTQVDELGASARDRRYEIGRLAQGWVGPAALAGPHGSAPRVSDR